MRSAISSCICGIDAVARGWRDGRLVGGLVHHDEARDVLDGGGVDVLEDEADLVGEEAVLSAPDAAGLDGDGGVAIAHGEGAGAAFLPAAG